MCISLYRSKYIPEDTIGVVDTKPKVEKHSKNSIFWLEFLQHKHDVNISHTLNGAKVSLPGIGKVNGFCEDNNTVYKFHGCYWHGCTKCFSRYVVNKLNGLDMRYLRDQTSKKVLLFQRITTWLRCANAILVTTLSLRSLTNQSM